jgi:hypothetical protein
MTKRVSLESSQKVLSNDTLVYVVVFPVKNKSTKILVEKA